MAKAVAKDIFARQPGETSLEWTLRRARMKANARDEAEPIVPLETQRQGRYARDFVTHVETNTKALTFRELGIPRIVEQWHSEGRAGFEQPAMDAMARCIAMWEARPILGNMAAGYKPAIKGGANDYDRHIIRALDDTSQIEAYAALFHPAHWRVFEAVVRYDKPIGVAGGDLEDNGPQSTASARAVVGLVANVIAQHMRA